MRYSYPGKYTRLYLEQKKVERVIYLCTRTFSTLMVANPNHVLSNPFIPLSPQKMTVKSFLGQMTVNIQFD